MEPIPTPMHDCNTCQHHHGQFYGSHYFCCAMHPSGMTPEMNNDCPDWSEIEIDDSPPPLKPLTLGSRDNRQMQFGQFLVIFRGAQPLRPIQIPTARRINLTTQLDIAVDAPAQQQGELEWQCSAEIIRAALDKNVEQFRAMVHSRLLPPYR